MYLWRLARLNSGNGADGLTYSEERLGLNPDHLIAMVMD